jgi:hypothetical protein
VNHLAALAAALTLTFSSTLSAQSAQLVEWVESSSLGDETKIALGYPVPIPVDTALPFDGFRSYSGLHMRHQDLAATTPWVHGNVIGSTINDRPVWLYQLGDENLETAYGLPEQAMLSNAGIHAREWQSPEVATGIIELIAGAESDRFLIDYLRENANMLVIPVQNVDGFLQTQRFPELSWVGADPRYPDSWPRDGRMRRKNMRGADEFMVTASDHLEGVDLNRNNEPFWADSSGSSFNPADLVYHGMHAASEPETKALDAAAQHGPASQLSMYTDIHSYSQVHFWDRTSNERLTALTERLLTTFSEHHQSFPAGKYYWFARWWEIQPNQGIGTTTEYFAHTYQVPAWTLEIEPSGGEHPGLPGGGADYGGLGRNGHDGFILPDSEVERVRTELAQTFTVAYYQQSGPPAMQALRLIDDATGAVVFDAEWDTAGPTSRQLHTFLAQPLQLDRDYTAWVAWNKPMRWRTDGEVTVLPGMPGGTLAMQRFAEPSSGSLTAELGEATWLASPGGAPGGFLKYRDDAARWSLRFPADETNLENIVDTVEVILGTEVSDMTGSRNDAHPSTVAHWSDGGWAGYEDSDGNPDTDDGGADRQIRVPLTAEDLGEPFVIEPGTSAAWFDIDRSGEGFMLEILAGNRAVMYWFTYDTEGAQDWYMAEGEVRGNRIVFPDMVRVTGGVFGPGFDPLLVERTPIGSASFIWSGCNAGEMSWVIDRNGGPRRQGRMVLTRLTNVMAIPCTAGGPAPADAAPLHEASQFSGSWFDPTHSGEGYVLQVLADERVLVYWFSYDAEGKRRWFFGTGVIDGARLVFEVMYTTSGGIFGPGFNHLDVDIVPWGSLELELACDGGTARFSSTEPGFPAGELNLVRLTVLDGIECPVD